MRSVTLDGSNLGITPEPKAAAEPTLSTFCPAGRAGVAPPSSPSPARPGST